MGHSEFCGRRLPDRSTLSLVAAGGAARSGGPGVRGPWALVPLLFFYSWAPDNTGTWGILLFKRTSLRACYVPDMHDLRATLKEESNHKPRIPEDGGVLRGDSRFH